MNEPESPWKRLRASSSPAVDRSGGRAEDLASRPTMSAAASPAGVATVGVGIDARVGVLDDLAAGRLDQGVDPHHVALVAAALHADALVLGLGRVDHLVPGELRRGRVDPGGGGDRRAVPEQLRVRPERRGDELVVPVRGGERPVEHPVGQQLDVAGVGDRPEVPGVRRTPRRTAGRGSSGRSRSRPRRGGAPAAPAARRPRSAGSASRSGRRRRTARRTAGRGSPGRRCRG